MRRVPWTPSLGVLTESEVRHGYEAKVQPGVQDRGCEAGTGSWCHDGTGGPDLDVHVSVLRGWVRADREDPVHAFPGHGQQKPEALELTQLRREVARLKMERDILKKAAAYFAKESM